MGIVFEHVSKRFGEVGALVDLSLTVADGEFMVLLGPSGCGKTTALRIVAGLEEPTEGVVSIDGRDVTDVPARNRDIAMVFQNYALYPQMSVYDNIAFGLRTRHFSRAQIDELVRDAAEMLGLSELLKRKPGQLSGGQRQRVALGRAIVRRPRAFLMDEPLSNLDAKLRAQTRLELIRLHRRLQTTVLYVTHDQIEAMTMGERIAVLDRGQLQQVGTAQEVYSRPANLFVAQFVGTPAMSLFRGPVRATEDGALVLEDGAVHVRLDSGQARAVRTRSLETVVAGVRPEHIELIELFGEKPVAASFDAEVDVVESLGNEVHAALLVDGRGIVARLPADVALETGTTRRFAVASQHVLLFDPQNERLIG